MAAYLLKQSTIETISHQLRDQNKTVIFTHGCFDLFHAGHAHLLNVSKAKGDTLIVGIESDQRIRKYKNPQRPIISDEARIQMLYDHRAVDFILHITGDMPWEDFYYLNMYKRLFPKYVTFGKTKGYIDKYRQKETQIKGVKYQQIRETAIETGSATKIIDKIAKLQN